MLYLFDLDGTLISGYLDNPDKDYDRWDVLPKRRAMLNKLLMRGDTICIVTNQGGVAFGYVTMEQAVRKIDNALLKLGLVNPRWDGSPRRPRVYACYFDARGIAGWNDPIEAARRKPSGAMIREAMRDHADAAERGVLMVGDRPEDEAAARDAGVPFQWVHEFFGAALTDAAGRKR